MKVFIPLTLLLLMSLQAQAGSTQAETEAQKRLLTEMQAIIPLIDTTQQRSDRQRRLPFDYLGLRSDLNTIMHGVHLAISGEQQESFAYPALAGNYGMAGSVGEAAAVHSILQELQALEPLVSEAEKARNPAAMIQFQYQGLRDDLLIVRHGLQQALDQQDNLPQHAPALRGQFSGK